MQGLILAAGMGKRLKDLTKDNTKCMVKVNGITLAERTLRQLDNAGLNRIVIVVGYEGQKLIDYIAGLDIKTPVIYVENPIYDKTNNIYSLLLAKDQLAEDDTLLLESDIIFEDAVLRALIDDPRPSLALVDKYESWMDGTCVTVDDEDGITRFISKADFNWDERDSYYKTVNLYKFSREFSQNSYIPFMSAYCESMGMNQYYEQVLKVITMLGDKNIKAKRLNGEMWYEIDDVQDLDIAESMFADPDERLDRVNARYGGYWRYPGMKDFCYLVNPYFPSKRLVDELKANFEMLLTQYPSGMKVNSLLAGKNFGVKQDHILVGNGAAELIKSLLSVMSGQSLTCGCCGKDLKLGVVRPTFEEYPNRYFKDKTVVFRPETDDFRYTADDLMEFFGDEDHKVDALVVINPDNPSGNYIPKADVLKLAAWCKDMGMNLILDESFVDFADEEEPTLIDDEILQQYPGLVVMKSISKSYGVPGIRLGVMASSNEEIISCMKKDVAIWNINSFAEYYMQIESKHHSAYIEGLEKFRAARAEYVQDLKNISGLRVFDTQANYVMAEITKPGMTARDLSKHLLSEDILIKDLTKKMGAGDRQFIRLAVRDEADNKMLTEALKKYLA